MLTQVAPWSGDGVRLTRVSAKGTWALTRGFAATGPGRYHLVYRGPLPAPKGGAGEGTGAGHCLVGGELAGAPGRTTKFGRGCGGAVADKTTLLRLAVVVAVEFGTVTVPIPLGAYTVTGPADL